MAITINAIIIAITDKPSIVKWRSPLWVRFWSQKWGARKRYRTVRLGFVRPPFVINSGTRRGPAKGSRWNDYYGPAGMIITDFVDDYVQDYVRDFCVYVRRFCLELAQPI